MDFRLLGSLEASIDGQPIRLAKRQQRAVLTALLLRPSTLVPVDRLFEALWPDGAPAGARESLHSHIARLRRALEPDRPSGEPPRRLLTERPGYRLVVEPDELDAARFESAAASGRNALAAGRAEAGIDLLRQAMDEWRGPALAKFRDEPFAEQEAMRLDLARIDVLEARLGAEVGLGRTEVIGELEALVVEQPFRERLWEYLLVSLYRAGRQAEAIRRGEEVRAVLAEAGLEPTRSLRNLEAAIFGQDPSLLTIDGHDAGSQPIVAEVTDALSRLTVTLPAPSAPHDLLLVGRDRELARFDEIHGQGPDAPPSLVVLNGEPGAGKTRLALELLHRAERDGTVVLAGRCSPSPSCPTSRWWPPSPRWSGPIRLWSAPPSATTARTWLACSPTSSTT